MSSYLSKTAYCTCPVGLQAKVSFSFFTVNAYSYKEGMVSLLDTPYESRESMSCYVLKFIKDGANTLLNDMRSDT